MGGAARPTSGGIEVSAPAPNRALHCQLCCPDRRLAIELDGEVHTTQQARDDERETLLVAARYRMLRFSNDAIFDDLPTVLETIRTLLELSRRAPHSRFHGPAAGNASCRPCTARLVPLALRTGRLLPLAGGGLGGGTGLGEGWHRCPRVRHHLRDVVDCRPFPSRSRSVSANDAGSSNDSRWVKSVVAGRAARISSSMASRS